MSEYQALHPLICSLVAFDLSSGSTWDFFLSQLTLLFEAEFVVVGYTTIQQYYQIC